MLNPVMLSASGGGDLSGVLTAMDDVLSFGTKVFSFCASNPILAFFLACSLVTAAIGVFVRIKGFASR